jgi:hypothetical protein
MADAMSVTLVFNGNGEEQAPPETQEEIVLFAQAVYTDAAR